MTKAAEKPGAAPASPEVLTPSLSPPPVGRTELLQAIAAARSAYASGQAETGAALAGRRFAIRQAFGCKGGSEAGSAAGARVVAGMAGWAWGRDHQTIDISLTPADWTGAPVVAGGTTWEAVEGYWLTRPWLRTEECPAEPAAGPKTSLDGGATPAEPKPAAGPTPLISGLAAVFPQQGSRVGRRDGRAFALTVRGDPPLSPPANGYRLVVEGRFSAFPDGRAIRCHSSNADQAPVCIAAAEIDRVAFEDADGKLLKEWRLG